MDKDYGMIATEVLRLLKKEYNNAIKRLYILLIIVMFLFAISIIDSIYQRCRIIKIAEEYNAHCAHEIVVPRKSE